MTVAVPTLRPVPRVPCAADPDRWAAGGEDPELKALCRGCPRRWLCASEALRTPGAEGMWSGVNIPKAGRGRTFALRQLRSLAAHGGYHVGSGTRHTRHD
ncbi:WhiB family transcriptional regulator [uncultured Mycobacterium sp.]|uniref:WhiB family transcriptional regulator n=1 Tax=uncultured Mycobacterium sp. TaxID=171292 RepID=UPI0035CB6152